MTEKVELEKKKLENHRFLSGNNIKSIEDLRTFMESHVYAVWDFMSLAKSLQHHIVPSGNLWIPNKLNHSESARLINEIILGEETDLGFNNTGYISHFELYRQAMIEIGANVKPIDEFIKVLSEKGLKEALQLECIPIEAKRFMKGTFKFIKSKKSYNIAAAFTFGRETIIPQMFIKIIEQLNMNKLDVPIFMYYLDRHIFLDSEEHGPASLKLINELINSNEDFIDAEKNALIAIKLRYKFWTELSKRIKGLK